MYETILVPLDGSRAAEMVIPYAVEIAANLENEIFLVSVSENSTPELHDSYLKSMATQVERQLKDHASKKEVKVHSEVLLGEPAREILNSAYKINASLIAMTSRGSSKQDKWLLGSIAAKVLRATNKPILLVRATASEAALRQKRLVEKILVPLDGSELGAVAIPYAEVLAQALMAELVFFQATPMTVTSGISEGGMLYGELAENMRASALAYLDSVAKPLKERGLKVSVAVALGSPADQIIDYAKQNAVDVIAMSTHGRTGIGRWVFGSVTDKVLHAGDTAVLVIRANKA